MTPIEFVIFEGDSTPNQPVYQIAEAMRKTIKIFDGNKEWEVLSYHWNEGHMTLDIQEKQEPVQFNCTVVDDQHPQGIPLEQWGNPPAAQPAQEPRLDQGPDYERGFVDGMQKQMQSSVDKAVNRMAQRPWVGLTDEEPAHEHLEKNMTGYVSKKMLGAARLPDTPSARAYLDKVLDDDDTQVYKRPWVGLSSVDFNDFNPLFTAKEAARWAEAKLKEKNG